MNFSSVDRLHTFKELGALSLTVLRSFPSFAQGKIVQVCGPVSTGGFDAVSLNFLVLSEAVHLLRESGVYVFDQTPLEAQFVRLWKEWKNNGNTGYCWPILEEVYMGLFKSKLISTLYFLPGWEDSVGACWERSLGLSLGMNIHPYPEELYTRILREYALD